MVHLYYHVDDLFQNFQGKGLEMDIRSTEMTMHVSYVKLIFDDADVMHALNDHIDG